jgi:hypothetical protein
MTIDEIKRLYRHQADDEVNNPYYLSDSDFLFFLNEAQKKAARNSDLLFDKTNAYTEIPVISGTSIYSINPLIYAITNVILTTLSDEKITLELVDREELTRIDPLWREKSEQPIYAIYEAEKLELAPNPIANGTLQLETFRYPVVLTSTESVLEIKAEDHEHLIDWIEYRAFRTKETDSEDFIRSNTAKQNFLAYFGQEPRSKDKKSQFANFPHRTKAVI